jgi:hypothetical protein
LRPQDRPGRLGERSAPAVEGVGRGRRQDAR